MKWGSGVVYCGNGEGEETGIWGMNRGEKGGAEGEEKGDYSESRVKSSGTASHPTVSCVMDVLVLAVRVREGSSMCCTWEFATHMLV